MRRCGKDDLDYVCMPARVYVEDLTNAYKPRPEYCPLIPVPSHGRLIDADALEQDAQKRLLICNKYNDQFQKPYEVMRAIALAPTVIPASEEDE
jgi:hypothetical protein